MFKMEVKELQKRVDEIINKIDSKMECNHDVNNTFIHLVEELGEVADKLNQPNIRGKELNKEELGKELSDMFFFILRLASLNGIDIEEAINEKIQELNQRHNLNL
jgi:NTP pyrophosphatase (non-canonical NTP hydrolase)